MVANEISFGTYTMPTAHSVYRGSPISKLTTPNAAYLRKKFSETNPLNMPTL